MASRVEGLFWLFLLIAMCFFLFGPKFKTGRLSRKKKAAQSYGTSEQQEPISDVELLENTNEVAQAWYDAMQKPGFDPNAKDASKKVLAQLRKQKPFASTYRYQPPVILQPSSRSSTNIEVDGTSWFGGLPTLTGQVWPRARDGSLMHPVAQIDLSELATIETPEGFPKHGALAFFVDLVGWPYQGKVLYVPHIIGEPTQPDKPLPRLFRPYDKMHYSVEGYAKDTAPRQFTRWPVTFTQLHMAEKVDTDEDSSDLDAFTEAFPDADENYFPSSQNYKDAYPELATASRWDTAQRFADMMSNSPATVPFKIEQAQKSIAYHPTEVAELTKQGEQIEKTVQGDHESVEEFTERVKELRSKHEKRLAYIDQRLRDKHNEIKYLKDNLAAFLKLVHEVEEWAYGHDRWDRMDAKDVEQLENYMSRVSKRFGETGFGLHMFMISNPHIGKFLEHTIQAMVQAPDDVYKELPKGFRDDFEKKGRIARLGNHHQMFGFSGSVHAHEHHRRDYLLLKLGRDSAMDWHWGEESAYFWISPEHLKNQDWEKVEFVAGQQ